MDDCGRKPGRCDSSNPLELVSMVVGKLGWIGSIRWIE